MLQVRELHAGSGAAEVVAGVSFAVEAGAVVALLGAPGAGKTSVLRAIAGLLAPTGGEVLLDGQPLHGRRAAEIARLGVALSAEGGSPPGPGSTEAHLLLGAAAWAPRLFGFRTQVAPDLARVYGLFPRLAERRAHPAATLSGGELRLLSIGAALMARPRLLLLDEPFTGLSPAAAAEVALVLGRLRAGGLALLLASQDARAALEVADRACVLERGRVVLEGTAAELRRDERALSAYLG